MRYLVVGDPHAVVDELSDCEKLVEAVSVLAKKHKPDNIIWLGDLCNNHAILRVEVLAFWRSVFDRFPNSIAIVGNHDMPQSGLGGHALSAFSSIQVIDSPTEIEPGIWALPYMSKEDFEGWMDKNKFKGVFCHQTFQGAKYENGFLAPDGVPTEKFKKKQWAISGHIHAASRIGPVWYVGSPRWRSVSDAGEEKAIHVVDIEAGEYDIVDSLDTSMFCQKIEVIEVKDAQTMELAKSKPVKGTRLVIKGGADFVKQAEKELAGRKTQSLVTGDRKIHIKESDGLTAAFEKYYETVVCPDGVDRNKLKEMFVERVR